MSGKAPARMAGRCARRRSSAPPTSSTRERVISDEVWAELRPLLSDEQLIEVCMLVGHYGMLAGTLNSLGVPLDEIPLAARRVRCASCNRSSTAGREAMPD